MRIYGFQAYLIRVLLPSPVTNLTNVLSEFYLESAKPLGVCLLPPRTPSFSLDYVLNEVLTPQRGNFLVLDVRLVSTSGVSTWPTLSLDSG